MLRQWNKSVPAGLENMLIWRLNQMTIIHLIGDWAISKSWAQFKICHCTVKACFWLKYINYSSSWSKTLTTIPSKALWHSPDLEEPARPPLLSRPLGHLWNPHWSAGICQIELLAPGIFGTRGLPEGKLCIGLSTRLCSKSGRTFEKGWWERRIRKLTLSHWWNQDDRQAVSVIFCVWSYPDTWDTWCASLMKEWSDERLCDRPRICKRVVDNLGFFGVTIAALPTILCHWYLETMIFWELSDFLQN